MDWFEIDNIDEIDSPAVLVFEDRIKKNIEILKTFQPNFDLVRPHVKTHKILEIAKICLNAGITKYKCATIAEAEMLGVAGVKNVLLAYQPTIIKAKRLLQIISNFPKTKYSCLIDNESSANNISKIFAEKDLILDTYIDLNVGMNRTGIQLNSAGNLFNNCSKLKGIKIVGLHAYDGHIYEKNLDLKKQICEEIFTNVIALKNSIEKNNKTLNVILGGSPSFPIYCQKENVECSPGTFVFWDWGYKHVCHDQPFEFGAVIVTRVISIVDENTVTIDLGYKSVASENPLPRVHFFNVENVIQKSQSEEHMVLTIDDSTKYPIGKVLYATPIHICPTIALYEKVHVVEDKKVVKTWPVIARNRFINY